MCRSSRFKVRVQAERHSTLLMCVPLSQNPMHAASVSPPPPGALGADSLGLGPDVADVVEEDVVDVTVPPPLESMIWAGVGDSGAMAASSGIGAAMAEGGRALAVVEELCTAAAAASSAAVTVD